MHCTNQVCRLAVHTYHVLLKLSSVHQHAFTILSMCPRVLSDKSNTQVQVRAGLLYANASHVLACAKYQCWWCCVVTDC